jgi:hypothetical protein
MTMIHHGSESYEFAAARAADATRAKFEALFDDGKKKAIDLLTRIESEQPRDRIVDGRGMGFTAATPNEVKVEIDGAPAPLAIHDHALGQVAARASIPKAYVDTLRAEGQADLLATNLKRRFSDSGGRYLVREVNGEARGVLSDRFR